MRLIDTTLREGAQAPGVRIGAAERRTIVAGLGRLGIEEIELGVAARDVGLRALVDEARDLAPRTRLALWCRITPADIALSAAAAPDVLAISVPASDLHLTRRLGRDRAWVLERIRAGADLARDRLARAGRHACLALGLEDASRADGAFLDDLAAAAETAGFDRLRLADTVGLMTPSRLRMLVERMRRVFLGEIAVHCHDDFGLADANAADSGADWADVSLLGLGERAGIARCETVAGRLALVEGATRYHPEHLRPLCAVVARCAGRTIPANHPVVGADIFTCASGLHVDGLAKDVRTYEPFAPERVGAQRRLLLGAQSGRGAVRAAMARFGVVDEDRLEDLVAAVRALGCRLGRPLTEGELLGISQHIQGSAHA